MKDKRIIESLVKFVFMSKYGKKVEYVKFDGEVDMYIVRVDNDNIEEVYEVEIEVNEEDIVLIISNEVKVFDNVVINR